ncbi:hypothetical protein X767_11115 [Mesorhizobium sp. LSJC264A00]|nr:hypothetical protein X767_11115 [Mesorhizobium sp. LSJC264A00]
MIFSIETQSRRRMRKALRFVAMLIIVVALAATLGTLVPRPL